MVNGINSLNALNAAKIERNGNNVNFGATTPYPQDSFQGKSLLMLAGLAGAVVFRKNIAGFFKNTFPGATKFVSENFAKLSGAVKNFCAKNKFAGKIAEYISKGTQKLKGLYNKIAGFFKPQPSVAKTVAQPATEAATNAIKAAPIATKPIITPDLAKAATAKTVVTAPPADVIKAAAAPPADVIKAVAPPPIEVIKPAITPNVAHAAIPEAEVAAQVKLP